MRVFDQPTDVLGAVGEELGPGDWVEITQQRVDAFADATDDHQWIHVDRERATAGPFGGTIAHGYLTLSLVPMLAAGLVAYEGCAAKINYGTDKVRFPQPLRVGGRIRARGAISAARETSAGVQVVLSWTVEIEDPADGDGVAAKPACVAEVVVLLVPA